MENRYPPNGKLLMMEKVVITNIDQYIAQFPEETQQQLERMRSIIKKAVPAAEETLGYGMPAFRLFKNLVYFAGYKNHIGLYPMPSAIAEFQEDFKVYKSSKGAIQFPIDKPLPAELITDIVIFRAREEEMKAAMNVKPASLRKKK